MECGGWPAELLKISKIIDIPWSIGMVRADKAGLILADTIQRKIHGSRPVTLIGYSLAGRVIYTCLMALAERRQFGLIDSVVRPLAISRSLSCSILVYSCSDMLIG